ncbi:F-box protein At5g07670-like [Malania oleifera]|uniref:F-box protein At5g07670-like n=1 Tax=Malania oleifera TaxID=397392 RepID=UPI0025AE9F84|nr:F-box protein At5g07670-like [Malania oleifera]
MSFAQENPKLVPPFKRPLDLWLKNQKALNHVLFAMHIHSLNNSSPPFAKPQKTQINVDRTLLLSDDILFRIFSKLPRSQRNHNSLVCKRWLALEGRLVRSLKVLEWDFLISGRLVTRFPNLAHVEMVHPCLFSPNDYGILLNHRSVSISLCTDLNSPSKGFNFEKCLMNVDKIDKGLKAVAEGCPNLRKLVVIGGTKTGLLSVGEECLTLQELELHCCGDDVLRGIAACRNLQVLKLIGNVDGVYKNLVSDLGLTILANGCERLVKLELSGCEGSYDGIKAIGQCCQMLEELTLCDHRMEGGWMAGLSFCENLKSLWFRSCKVIDSDPGPDEYLGFCPALERLHLQRCQLRDRHIARAMFMICGAVREIIVEDCWGLDNDVFRMASACRRVNFLSLEGCSLLTAEGLEPVILSWKELQRLCVVSCKSIKVSDVSPALSTLFSALKELTWRPDSKSFILSSLVGTGMGRRGSKFLRRHDASKLLFDY